MSALRRRLVALPLLLLLLPAACAPGPAPAAGPPNVVIWLVDTLRADHLHAYGYDRPTSPNLDRLAAEGVLFEDFHVHSNWTQPSVASLLTGRLAVPFEGKVRARVPRDMILAAEWFARHGRQTVGLTITAATAADFGFDRGFETWREVDKEAEPNPHRRKLKEGEAFGADRLVDAFVGWLADTREDGRPFFAFLHSVDPHAPYGPHAGQPSFCGDYSGDVDGSIDTVYKRAAPFDPADRRHLLDLYDDEIRFNDQQLGRVLDELRQRGLLDRTLVVVIADHGEELWDRAAQRPAHGHLNLHRELTRVPLVLRLPGALPAGLRVHGLMRGVDLLPTLVELARMPPLPRGDGASVAASIVAGEARLERNVQHIADQAQRERGVLALRTNRLLFQLDVSGHKTGLYHLRDDADERRNLSFRYPELVEHLTGLLLDARRKGESLRGRDDGDPRPIDPETLEALRALGYGDGGDDG